MPKSAITLIPVGVNQNSILAQFSNDLNWAKYNKLVLKELKTTLGLSESDSCHFWLTKDGQNQEIISMDLTTLDLSRNRWMIMYSFQKGHHDYCLLCFEKLDIPYHRLSKAQMKRSYQPNLIKHQTPDIVESPKSFNISQESNIAALITEVRGLSGKIDTLSDKVDLLSQKVDKNSEDINNLSTKVEKNSQDIKVLSTKVEKNSEDIKVLSTKVDRNSEDIKLLSTKVDRNSKDIKLLSTKVDRNSKDINIISKSLDETHREISDTYEVHCIDIFKNHIEPKFGSGTMVSYPTRGKKFDISSDLFSLHYRELLDFLPKSSLDNVKWTRDDPRVSKLDGVAEADIIMKFCTSEDIDRQMQILNLFISPKQPRYPVSDIYFSTCGIAGVSRENLTPANFESFSKHDANWQRLLFKMLQLERAITGANKYYGNPSSAPVNPVGVVSLIAPSFSGLGTWRKRQIVSAIFSLQRDNGTGLPYLKALYEKDRLLLLP